MDFSKIKYALEVAEQESFSGAAKKCFISQPAITKAIKSLEEELGVVLFDRSGGFVRLTYAGEQFVEEGKKILAQKERLEQKMQNLASNASGRLRIGIPASRMVYWLPKVLPRFINDYPQVKVEVFDGHYLTLERQLRDGEIDILFVGTPTEFHPDVEYITLCHEQMMLVFSEQHELFKGITIKHIPYNALHYIAPECLNGQQFISSVSTQGIYNFSKKVFEKLDISPTATVQVNNSEAAYHMAAAGLGFAFAPVSEALYVSFESRPVFLTISDPPLSRLITISYKKDASPSLAAAHFIKIAQETLTGDVRPDLPVFYVEHDLGY